MKKQFKTSMIENERNEYTKKDQRKAHKDFRMQRKQRNTIWMALEA